MRRALLIAGGLALLAVAIVFFVAKRRKPTSSVDEAAVALVKTYRRTASSNAFVRPVETNSAPVRLKVNLPDDLSEESQLVISDSLRTFEALEVERRRATGNGARLLEALQRKLLLDDYTYAFVLSGKDCSRAAAIHSNLVNQVRAIDTKELERTADP